MQKIDFRNIEKVPGRCGGRAVIAGTRIRASLVLTCYRMGMSVEEIIQQYPRLRPSDVYDALAYAYDHPVEMEDEIAADDEEMVQQRYPGGSGHLMIGDSTSERCMTITVEAIYEDGVLKPSQPLPLKEHEKVRLNVHSERNPLLDAHGIMGFKGTPEELEHFALDDEFDPLDD